MSAEGMPWSDNVGGTAAPEVANPTLTLSSVGPTSGSTAGGQTVTLRGAGFVAGTTVQFGSSACTSVVIVSASELTCQASAGSGTVDVSVTNPDSSTASLPAAYTYVTTPTPTTTPAPTTAPAPTTSPTPVPATPSLRLALDLTVDGTLDGDQIVVSGEGLQPNTIVSIRLEPGGVELGQATVGADGTFRTTVTVPAGLADGTYEVVADGVAADGSPVSVRGTFVVRSGSAAPAALAFTGSSSWGLATAGVLLTALGAVLVATSRRRQLS
jgi:hypothetical protein